VRATEDRGFGPLGRPFAERRGDATKPRRAAFAAIAALLLTSLACATPVGVRRVDARQVREQVAANVIVSGRPSAPSLQLLDRLDLSARYRDTPAATLAEIHAGLGGPDTPARLLSLSELSFHHAERSNARPHYLAAALYAYAYLFPAGGHGFPDAFDPGLRLAAELYNGGLTHGLATHDGRWVDLDPRRIELPFGELALGAEESSFLWGGYRLVEFVPTAELEVRGLRNRYRRTGIGAPLAASVRELAAKNAATHHRIPPRVKVPVTAFVDFGNLAIPFDGGTFPATVRLFVMDATAAIEIGSRRVPLEYDSTAPLAYMLEDSPIWGFGRRGFLSGDLRPFKSARQPDGLVLMHPYHAGRVPVVLVHGTASSPARWAELVNELNGDPSLAKRIQIWLFMYTTGNPILYSGRLLRVALAQTRTELDPGGRDAALRQMVVIGHSQGGLLTRLTAVDPGTTFWDNVTDVPFEEVELSPETREFVQELAFFEPLPFVTRVVYIATPHHGSFLAARRLAGFAAGLVEVPGRLVDRTVDLVRASPDAELRRAFEHMPTSIDNMRPSHPFTKSLSSLSEAPWVSAHSIIAVRRDGPPEGQSDGVVAFESARIEGVASELVVRSGHSTQGNPHTIAEVKRILREHLDSME
jgi:hypothetical protein